jgi:hypothetical protein
MIVKLCYVILMVTVLLSAQNPIRISGTVFDKSTNTPLSGATVKLLSRNLTAQTGPDGTFSIAGTGVRHFSAVSMASAYYISNNQVHFSLPYDQNVQIAIHDLHGRLAKVLYSGMMNAGTSNMRLPELPDGVYVCMLKTSENTYSTRFLSQHAINAALYNGSLRGSVESDIYSIRSAAAMAVDSIVVSKTGYTQASVAIDTLVKSDLVIQLTPENGNLKNSTIVPDPSWTCFMPNGIPPPEMGTKVFTVQMKYQTKYNVGKTKFGTRRFFDINSGTIDGSKLKGTLYSGGLDLELTLSNGSTELEQIIIIKTSDNKPILMRNAGVAPAGTSDVRVVLDFEAPNSSSYTWLHTGKFAATRIVDTVGKTITMDVYDITNVTLPATKVQIKDPSGVTNQTWECLKLSGTSGNTVITEDVICTGQINIGATKNGSRNIIPITGGTTTGKVVGKILNGGADYQMGGLDARYTLAPNDGEFILVRNCGSGSGLVPVFEARVDGPYAFLNENKYLSDGPIVSTTSTGMNVKILFHEIK